MNRNFLLRLLLALTVLAALAGPRGFAGDQPSSLPIAPPEVIGAPPTPATPSTPETTPAMELPTPAPYVLPKPGWPTLSYPFLDPLLDRPDAAQPGWYTNAETNLIFPYLRNQLKGSVINEITGNRDIVRFTGNPLDFTVMPRVELGYRLANGWGSLQLGYRGLSTRGSQTQVASNDTLPPMLGTQQGRLDLNILDLTYVSHEFSLRPNWNLRAGAGARIMTLFFDSRIQFVSPPSAPGSVLSQGVSSGLYGIGAWAFVEVERRCTPISGLNFFDRIEGHDLISRINHDFTEDVTGGPGAPVQSYFSHYVGSVGTPALRGIVGLSYVVPNWNYSRFMLGYQYESFFQIGRLTSVVGGAPPADDDRGQLNLQGVYLRAEFNF